MRGELAAPGILLRPEEGPAGELRTGDVIGDGVRCGVVQADGPAFVPLLAQPQACPLAVVLLEIFDLQAAPGRQADAAIQEQVEDGAIATGKHRVAAHHLEQGTGERRRQGQRLVAGIGGSAGDEPGTMKKPAGEGGLID